MFVLLASLTSIPVLAQGGYQVKGVVVDEVGPVIGAAVVQQGTTNGTSTGIDGDFVLNVPDKDAVIEISCIGYATLTFKASEVPAVVTLAEDTHFLDEVVVIGYGTVKKTDMTGSVSTVRADQVNKGIASSPSQLLAGKAGGVVVTAGDGAPGSASTIRIRGGSSLTASNDPLIIVDGLPVGTHGIGGMSDPLASINPDDIESFTVLKDASATAIYGSRASNGVIIITTKTGKRSDGTIPRVNADFTTSLSQNTHFLSMLTGDQLRDVMLGENGYIATRLGNEKDRAAATANMGSANTDWQRAIYRLGKTYEGNVGVTGNIKLGKDNYLPYRVSGGGLSQEGTLLTSSMKRANLAVNLNPSFFDKHLKLDLSAKETYMDTRYANTGAIGAAAVFNPTQPIYDNNGVNGYYTIKNSEGGTAQLSTMNPVAALYEYYNQNDALRFIGNAQIDYAIHGFEDLHLHANLGMDTSTSKGLTHVDAGAEQSYHDQAHYGAGSNHPWNEQRMDKTLELYANYNKELGSHSIGAMAGYSWQEFKVHSWGETTSANGKEVFSEADDYDYLYRLISFYGRANYSFDGKYLLTATIRADGTSRFVNNKWGIFPSVALAWNAKNENFLKNVDAVTTAKLRLSWGQTGQQEVGGYYDTFAKFLTNQLGSYYFFNDRLITPISALGYSADLRWETTTTYNVGFDLGFWNDRLTAAIDVYKRDTKDILNYIPVPALSNLTNYLNTNIGNMTNLGAELDLNAILIERKDMSWTAGFNVAYNHNEITKLTASDENATGVETGGISGGTGNNVQMFQVGFPMRTFNLYKQVYDQNGNPINGVYVDMNGDGQITADDKYMDKRFKASPDFTFGFNTSFSYKNWTAALSGHASLGNWVYNNVASDTEMLADLWTNSFIGNRVSSATRSMFSQAQYLSDYYLQNGSFLKFDNFTLGYTFPKLFKVAENDASLNVFATVQNIYTLTKYTGIDPEVYGGIDGTVYPRPRTFILGLKFNF